MPINKFNLLKNAFSDASDDAINAALGITSVGTASTTAATGVTGLGAALKGLWASNPFLVIAMGATVAITAITGIKNALDGYKQEQISAAREAGSAWQEQNSSMDDQITKIRELREALNNGNLTEQEAYDKKSQLLNIQSQLIEQYGQSAQGIDLVNGSIETQIALLDKLSRADAQAFLNENRAGIAEAEKAMKKTIGGVGGLYLGSYSNGYEGTEQIQNILDKYDNIETSSDGVTTYVYYKGDATQAKSELNSLMTEVSKAEEQIGKTDIIQGFADNASAGLSETNKILDEYESLYKQAAEARLIADEKLYTISTPDGKTKSQSAISWLNDYTKAIKNYNEALASGDSSKIAETKKAFDDVKFAVDRLLLLPSMQTYTEQFGEVTDQLNQAAEAAYNFKAALSGDDYMGNVAKKLKDSGMTDIDVREIIAYQGGTSSGENPFIKDYSDAVNELFVSAQRLGIVTGTETEQVQQFCSILEEVGIIATVTGDEVLATGEKISTAFNTSVESVNNVLSQITEVKNALSAQSTGSSINIGTFNSEELKDYQSALEYVNGTMQLNADKVKEITKAKADEIIAQNDINKAQAQAKYLENAKEIDRLRDSIKYADESSQEYKDVLDQINTISLENDSIVNQCSQWDLLNASIREATGEYQAWLNAQKAGDSGDMASDVRSAISNINDANDTNSEEYGRFYTPKYETAVDFLVPEEVSAQGQEAVKAYTDNLSTYFTGDMEGAQKYVGEAIDKGLMEWNPDGKSVRIAAGKTMKDFIDAFNWTDETTQAMFGDLQTYFGQDAFSWADETVQTLGDLGIKANEAAEQLKGLSGNENLEINMDVSDIEDTDQKVAVLNDTIRQMQEQKSINVDSTSIDNANAIIQYCVAQKQRLEAPVIMSVDTSGIDDSGLANAVSLLQQLQSAQNETEAKAAIGADTSEAQAKVDALVSDIQGLSPEIQAKLNLDTTSLSTINESLANMDEEVLVKAGIDDSAIVAYNPDDKSAKVVYTVDHSAVDSYNPKDLHRSVTYTVHQVGSAPTNGSISINGTANASGTALVNGNWSARAHNTTGTTLIGELGPEIVVHGDNGTWEERGVNGAEFYKLKPTDIVFNHLQSAALLERGHVFGRGSATISGTAKVTGDNLSNSTFLSGIKNSSSSSSSSSSTSSTIANTKAQDANTKATNKNTSSKKKEGTIIDWIQRKLTYFGNKTKEIADSITDYVSSAFKTAQLKKQISSIDKEIIANQQGYERYMQEANSVGLSDKYKKLVQNGTIDIQNITDQKLADKISKYQDYYDKAVECKQAVTDLKNEQLELFEQWANMPTEAAEKKIDKLERSLKSLNAAYDTISGGGSATSQYAKLIEADYNAQLNAATTALNNANAVKNSAATNKSTASANLSVAKQNTNKSKSALQSAIKKKSNKVSSSTKKKINAAIKAGTTVSTKGLKGAALQAAKVYNADIQKQSSAQSSYNSSNAAYQEAVLQAQLAAQQSAQVQQSLSQAQSIAKQYANDTTYRGSNALLDAQLNVSKQESQARQTALNEANKNLATTQRERDAALARKNQTAQAKQAAINARDAKKNSILNNKSITKYLKSSQLNALKSGQEVSTKGIKNKTALKQIQEYNKLVKQAQTASTNATNAVNAATQAEQKYSIALEAQQNAQAEAAQAQAEYAQMIVDNEKSKFENIKKYYEARLDYESKLADAMKTDRDLKEAYGQDTTTADYQNEINNMRQQKSILEQEAKDLQNQLNGAVSSGIIKQNSEEWYEMQLEIVSVNNEVKNMEMSILELQDTMRNEVFYRELTKALETAEKLRKSISSIRDIISDEMLFDDNGNYTQFGITALAMDIKEYESYLESISTLINKRNQMIRDFNGGNNSTNYSQSEFDADMAQISEDIQGLLSDTNTLRESIISSITSHAQEKLNVISKAIDAQSELLRKQKEYQDYDKTLKDKTNSVKQLEQQIRALDGATDAASRAQKARLEAQKKEAEDALNDTIREHVYDLRIDGLDDLKTELQDNYDKYVKDLNSNLESIVSAVDKATGAINKSLNTVNDTVQKLLNSYGVPGLTTDVVGIPHYASGTKSAKGGWSRINENGNEILILEDGSVLLPLTHGTAVENAKTTESILDSIQNYPQMSMPEIKIPDVKISAQSGGNTYVSYDSLIRVDGNVDKYVVDDLKDLAKDLLQDRTFMQGAYKYTSKEIAKDLRK